MEWTDREVMIITTLYKKLILNITKLILNMTKLPGICTASAHDVELKSSSVLPCHIHWYTPASLVVRLVRDSVFKSILSGRPL